MIMRACVIMHNMIVEDEGVVDPKEREVTMCNLSMARLLVHLMNLLMHTKGSEARKHMFS